MHYFLRQIIPPDSGQPIEIHITEDEITVGRRNIITLTKFPQISREHAVFYRSVNGNVYVKDLNSLNGIFVNDVRIGTALKDLTVGDHIGFGVTTSAAKEGFVCILCAEPGVKKEVIDISDDHDDDPVVVFNLKRTSNPGNSSSRVSIPSERSTLSSRNQYENASCSKDLSNSYEIRNDLISHNDDPVAVLNSKMKSNPRNSASQVSIPREKGTLSPLINYESASSNKDLSKFYEIKNDSISQSDINNSSQSHEIRKTIRSQNIIINHPFQKSCEDEKAAEIVSVKKCIVPVVRCDSYDFNNLPNVKNLFKEGNKQEKHPFNRRKKPVKKLSSDSSDSFEGDEQPGMSSKENVHNFFSSSKDYNCSQMNPRHAEAKKRKLSDVSGHEIMDNMPSTSKKTDCVKNRVFNNFKPGAKSCPKLREKPFDDDCYSQVEEIIYISDDETYLDFKSSQDYVHIKKEPEEIEDLEDDDIYKEIFERESNYEFECAPNTSKVTPQSNDSDDKIESIEAIRAFVSKSEQNSVRVKNMFSNADQDTDSESCTDNDSDSDNLHKSNTSAVKSHLAQSAVQNSAKESQIPDINPAVNKNSKKCSGRVLLIEPKPMTYRPRRLRGRDEGFVEKNRSPDQPIAYSKRYTKGRNKFFEDDSDKRKKSSTPNSGKRIKSTANSEKREKSSNSGKREKSPTQNSGKIKKSSLNSKYNVNEVKTNEKSRNDAEFTSTKRTKSSGPKALKGKKLPETFSSQRGVLSNEADANLLHKGKKIVAHKSTYDKNESPQHTLIKNRNISKENNYYSDKSRNISSSINKIVNTSKSYSSEVTDKCTSQSSKEKYDSSFGCNAKENKCIKTTRSTKTHPFTATGFSRNTELSTLDNSLYSKISFDGVIKNIIQMNTMWLQEQTNMKIPPSAVTKGAADLPLTYVIYNSYASSFYPMIILEIWEYMYTESKEIYSSNKQYKKFYFTIISYTSREDCIELKCEAIVNEKLCFGPREGVIAIFEMKENVHKCSPLFGYIYKHKIEPLNLKSIKTSCWKDLPENWLKSGKQWTFNAYIKKKEMSFELGSVMKGNGLCYIRNKLRLADALLSVKDSPLLKDILIPREPTFSTNKYQLSPTREYSSSQMEVIRGVSEEIKKPPLQPKILLLQGPPGTGKTHCIIGLVEKLFYNCENKSNFKILITAPSNEAIDEIGCRLIELDENSGWRDNKIEFVRVGLEKQIHEKMMPYFVDRKAKNLYQKSSQLAVLKEKELQKILSEINKLEMDPPSKNRNEKIKYLKDKCKNLRDKNPVNYVDYYTEMNYKTTILKESHIVLSTLSSCGLSLLLKTFKSNSNIYFSCCIIDDATQCTELEVLQPLVFGISKLVLVGDSEQLPPSVLSKLASQYGFERSMFERFCLYFQKLNRNPVLTLTEQFRMHSAICEFPSKHFYAHKLFTHPDTSLRYKEFPLNPYIVLDFSTIPISNDIQLTKEETDIILNICKFLKDFIDCQRSVGIIVSHQAKCSSYLKAFHCHAHYKQMEINTVDGFKSREKDVIILSSINATSHPDGKNFLSYKQHLNVAITRARKCLIICVNSTELMNFDDWRALIHDAQERKLCIPVTSSKHVLNVLDHYIRRKRN